MSHDHSHNHPVSTNLGRAMLWGIVLNLGFVVVEFAAGRMAASVALASDAAHNLGDAAGLLLAYIAVRMAQRRPTARYTFGYARSTILASLVNAGLLLVACGALGVEAIHKFLDPGPVNSSIVIWTAAAGILVNLGSARLLHGNHQHDLNVRGAYLHLMADAAVSLAVVISGVITYYTGILWIDPTASLLVVAVILVSTWGLLKEGILLSLDAVPAGIDPEKIRREACKIPGITELHHVHIWPLSTTETALTAHIRLEEGTPTDKVSILKEELRHRLIHLGISHVTLETELPGDRPVGHTA